MGSKSIMDFSGEIYLVDEVNNTRVPLKIEEIEVNYINRTRIKGYLCENVVSRNHSKIKKVIFNDPATIVIWSDNSKTVVKCQPGDTYSKELGLAMCISKKYLGNKGNFNEEFKKWIPDEPTIDYEALASLGNTIGSAMASLKMGFSKGFEDYEKFLKTKETEDIPVKKMREELDDFCHEHICGTHCLLYKGCECGRGKYFTYTNPNDLAYMTDDEIRDAYNRVFGKKKKGVTL